MDNFFVLISNWLGPDRSEVKVESFVDTKSIQIDICQKWSVLELKMVILKYWHSC